MSSGAMKVMFGYGLAADLPDPAVHLPLIHPEILSLYMAQDTDQLYRFKRETPEWIPMSENFANLLDVDWTTPPTDGQVFVWDTGTSKLIPFTLPSPGIPDAPSDGDLYGRKDAVWEVVPAPGIPDAPSDGTGYVRKDAAWVAESGGGGGSLPVGGTTGQVLTKQSGTDGDADWETPSGGTLAVGSHRYWALFELVVHGGGLNDIIGELRWSLTSGGSAESYTAEVSTNFSGSFPTSNLNDGNLTSDWAAAGNMEHWVVCDFTTPKALREMKMYNSASTGRIAQQPRSGGIYYSDDKKIWIPVCRFLNTAPVADVWSVFDIPLNR